MKKPATQPVASSAVHGMKMRFEEACVVNAPSTKAMIAARRAGKTAEFWAAHKALVLAVTGWTTEDLCDEAQRRAIASA